MHLQDPDRKAGLLILKHDHFTPARQFRQDVRAPTARNHAEGRSYPIRRHAFLDQLPESY